MTSGSIISQISAIESLYQSIKGNPRISCIAECSAFICDRESDTKSSVLI